MHAPLVRALIEKPDTTAGLVERLAIGRTAAYRIVNALHSRLRLIHICEWRLKPRAWPVPVFAFGAGLDVPPPEMALYGRRSRYTARERTAPAPVSLIVFASLVRALSEPRAVDELVEITGANICTIRRAVRVLHAERLIRIARYEAPGGRATGGLTRLWQWAPGQRDANRPRRKPKREINRRHRERMAEGNRSAALLLAISPMFGMAA